MVCNILVDAFEQQINSGSVDVKSGRNHPGLGQMYNSAGFPGQILKAFTSIAIV